MGISQNRRSQLFRSVVFKSCGPGSLYFRYILTYSQLSLMNPKVKTPNTFDPY